MVILMIYSCTPIGDKRVALEAQIRALPFVTCVDGSEGPEGWDSNVHLADSADASAALFESLSLLRSAAVPHDTYIVDDDLKEHYVFTT
jgi:hypothetical protein